MLAWFAGLSWLLVWRVFRSPAVDYRLVVAGALIPLVDLMIGHPTPLHTVVAPIVVMALVMVVARGRRLAQRQWLGLPIGMFTHLVFDATWADTKLFWWPLSGAALVDLEIPEVGWPIGLVIVLELVGLAVLVGLWVRLGLTSAANRERFLHSGHLDRDVA